MTGSRCLQCGAQLRVLRKLTGGEFCSEAHRQAYHEELNRMALSRLMQARSREEKPARPVEGRVIARSLPEREAESPVPAAAGFMNANLSGRDGQKRRISAEQPVPFSRTLLYPDHSVPALNDFTRAPAFERDRDPEPSLALPVAGQMASSITLEMYLTPPEMRCDLEPVEFGTPELLPALSSAINCPATLRLEEQQLSGESVPPYAGVPLEITIRALEQAQPDIIRYLEPLPAAPLAPVLPGMNILPLRPAITFSPPPKPVVKREIELTPPSRGSGPRLVIKAAPTPGKPERAVQPNGGKKPVTAALPPTETPAAEVAAAPETAPETMQMSAPLTFGMPPSEMGSPVFRAWYATPAKLKVAIVGALLAVVAFSAISKYAARSKANPAAGVAAVAPVAGFAGGGSIAMGGGGWITEWAGDSKGSKRGKQLTLYKPSMQLKDYRTEFVGQIETGSLGWVFRAKDTKNYYAMKIRIVRPGIEPGIVLERYAVVEGVEGPHVEVPLNLTVRNDTLYKVKIDVQGARFSTYIQGKVVDVWSDDRLASGGFGFSNERAERAHIRSVSVSF